MCGIAGSVNFRFSPDEVIRVMGHRGPDDQQEYHSGNVQFLHLRLAIVDLAGGRQPMHYRDRYTLIFNGEIYNHLELRRQFNLQAKTGSDTETLLLLYDRLGTRFLDYTDGMFAFAIHDREKNELFLARDRAGKKPLYYYHSGDQFVFASELNGLKALLPLQPEPDHFFQYLRLGSFYRERTPYQNVHELPGGSFLTIDCRSLERRETRWWDIHDYYLRRSGDAPGEALANTDAFLHQAVRRRIESSDLEVGCFLSGGIDSGLVTSIASEYNSKLKTFTISFEGAYDEAPLAQLVADRYGTRHTALPISFSNLQQDLEKILANYGEPFFDSSAVPSYYVSQEAKKYVTVILNGDGADELFGGYRRYVPFARHDFFNHSASLEKVAGALKKLLPGPGDKRSLYNYFYRLAALASKSDVGVYLSAGVDIFEDYETELLAETGYLEPVRRDFARIAGSDLPGLHKIMNLDFDTNLFDDLLVKMDIATMAHSLEGRSPFLSKELLEYIPTLPPDCKVRGKTTKYLLRRLAEKYLPAPLIHQPKRGFEIPLKRWVDHELHDIVTGYLLAANPFYANFVNEKFVRNLVAHKIRVAPEKRAKILWTLLSLEIWYKKVYQCQQKT